MSKAFSDLSEAVRLISPLRRVSLVAGLFLLSFLDLMGLGMLLPFLALGTMADSTGTNKFSAGIATDIFDAMGLPSTLLSVLAVFTTLVIVKTIISIFMMQFIANTVAKLSRRVRLILAQSIFEVRWPWLVHQQAGSLSALVSHNTSAVGEMVHNCASLASKILQTFVYLLLAFFISLPVALLALVIGALMVVWLAIILRIKSRMAHAQVEAQQRIAGNFGSVLTAIRPIRGMGRAGRLAEIFTEESVALNRALKLRVFSADLSADLLEPLAAVALACWFYLAVTVWQLHISNLLLIGLLLVRVVDVIVTIYRLLFRISEGRQGFSAVLAVIAETRAEREHFPGSGIPSFAKGIEIKNISFSYGEKPVLIDCNLFMPSGSITALSGPSGVGKSTFVDLLLGLQEPQAGEILIDDQSLFQTISIQDWRSQLGYVPQDQTLLNDTIMTNVTLGDDRINEDMVIWALQIAQAWDFVQRLPYGIHNPVGERGSALSGGQRQRIAIARALVNRPKFLILDEATTALDPQTEKHVCEEIIGLSRTTGMTVLAISHQPAWLKAADRIVEIEEGTFVAEQEDAVIL